ncbi:transcription factor HES-4-like [Rhinatrema bivittatum]|uniref:transcription factor HES-4-like n=1 Tax=Rhinatrema bivittatum TaxID=194408 RepID=UPI001126683F|nr:transcription factor HES-4-like [Rhinatrema bivittatum]
MEISPAPENVHIRDSPTRLKISPAIYKKSIKPLIEKKRRARINASLGQLKELLLQVAHPQPPRTSRLEKADILELTVRQLEKLKRTDLSAPGQDFVAGFKYCSQAVASFLESVGPLDPRVKSQILAHLDLAQSRPAAGDSPSTSAEMCGGGRGQLGEAGLWKEEKSHSEDFSVWKPVIPACPIKWHPLPLAAPVPRCSIPSTASAPLLLPFAGPQVSCWGLAPSSGSPLPVWRPW